MKADANDREQKVNSKRLNSQLTLLVASALAGFASILSILGTLPSEIAIGLVVGQITTFISYQFSNNNEFEDSILRFEKSLEEVKPDQFIKSKIVEPHEFYERLQNAVSSAKKRLYFCSFMEGDKSLNGVEPMTRYFDSGEKNFMQNGYLSIKRIITVDSISKLKWVIEKQVIPYKKLTNFNLYLAPFKLPYMDVSENLGNESYSRYKFPIPLNVQIIDSKEVFIVNPKLGTHKHDDRNISIYIESEEIGEVLTDYYDALCQKCLQLYSPGELNLPLLRSLLECFDPDDLTRYREKRDYEFCDQKIQELEQEEVSE